MLFLICCSLFGRSACQMLPCTWEVPIPIGLAWPVPNHAVMLGHLLSCGTGTAACEAIAEDCPHRCRLRPLLGVKKRLSSAATESWRAGRCEGDETRRAEVGTGTPSAEGKGTLGGELRSWGSSHLWLWLHESINKARLGWREWLLERKRLTEQISW